MRRSPIKPVNPAVDAIVRIAARRFLLPAVLALACAGHSLAQAAGGDGAHDSDFFGSEMKSLLAEHQQALASGDPDRIYTSSCHLAVATLALLNGLDKPDQVSRKADGALLYTQGLLTDLPTETMLFDMELNLGEPDQADALRKHILSTNPESAETHLALAEALGRSSQFGAAVQEAQRAVDLDPNSSHAQTVLGMAYWGINGFQYNEGTLKAFTAAQRLDPDGFGSNMLLGMIESQYEQWDDAAAHLQAAAAVDATAPLPWYQLGMNAYEQGRSADSGNDLKHYLELSEAGGTGKPGQTRIAMLTLDEIAVEQGETPDPEHRQEEDELKQQVLAGSGAMDAAAAPGAPGMGSSAAAGLAPVEQKPDAGKIPAEMLAELRAVAADSLGNIGTVLARRHDYAAAVLPFKYSVDEDSSSEVVLRNLGLAACVSGQYEDGADALKQVVAAHPEDGIARACLGMAQYASGEYADAASSFAALGDGLKSQPLFYATAAAAFARTGDRARAAQTMTNLAGVNGDAGFMSREAVASLDLGDTARADELAGQALNGGEKGPADALRVLGLLDLEQGNATKAAAEFENESQAEPEGSDEALEAQALEAEALIESGKRHEGEALSVKVAHADPKLAQALVSQAQELKKNGDVQGSFEKLAAAVALAPVDRETRAAFEKARRDLRTAKS